ncbi:diacylglycerol kinase family protein [Leifsonia flava]|uniref:Phosphatase PAP2 family protein n=1 Tax=Orlajensenia leifsoniae TaxID=2561933 RepID=A0A4Y9R4T1_9MICO|nr:diacylglycerol kinase family protein [Leifsonia flava]TFV98932.1 phosphatase PAP2 family protein [Leifsonia flava]
MAWWNLRHPIETLRRARVLPPWVRRIDERTAARVNGRHTIRGVDAVYVALSSAANRGVLWFAVAGVLVLLGHRRAAVRGAASLVVASATANLVGKQLFGGARPALDTVPHGRRLRTTPTSGSFPSGHSASAAAFAAGVAVQSPVAGAVIAPLAGAVAYSRLHTGAHWLSDVLGGVGIGLGVAAAGAILVPAHPRNRPGPVGASDAVRDDLPASVAGDGVFVIVNPGSGHRGEGEHILDLLRRRLPAATVHPLAEGEDVASVLRSALDSDTPPRVLGISGGDGTVASVAHLAREADLPLLVIPGGTFNHFAKALGALTPEAALDALATGTGLRVDVGELRVADAEPVTVLNTMSIGLYPEFVQRRERIQKAIGKPLATLVSAVGILNSTEPVELTARGERGRAWSLFVGVDRYEPSGTAAPLRRSGVDDGVLDVRVLRAGSRARTRGAAALILGRRSDSVLHSLSLWSPRRSIAVYSVTELEVEVHGDPGALGYAHDGEATDAAAAADGRYTVAMRLIPAALTVYSPQPTTPEQRASAR